MLSVNYATKCIQNVIRKSLIINTFVYQIIRIKF